MGSYAENEQDAREYAELQRQFAEEKLEEQKERAKEEKPVVTMDEIIQHRFQQRSLENAKRHMQAQNDWSAYLEKYENPDGDYERSDEELAILKEINHFVLNEIQICRLHMSIDFFESFNNSCFQYIIFNFINFDFKSI